MIKTTKKVVGIDVNEEMFKKVSPLSRCIYFFLFIVCTTIHLPIMNHSPVFGINTRYMPKGKWGYQFKNLYFTKDDTKDTIDFRNTLIYGVTNKLTVDFAIPYLLRYSLANRSAGISDVALKLNYIMYTREEENSIFRLFVQDLVRFPTGNPCTIPALGTGTYRNRIGFTGDYDTPRFGIYGATIYEYSLNTYKGFHPGDLWEWTLTIEAKPSKNLACLASIDYYLLQKDSKNDVPDVSSGGSILYIGPEIYYRNQHIKIAGSIQVPAFHSRLKQTLRAGFLITAYF